MASAADKTLGGIAEDVLGVALAEIVGRAHVAGFKVKRLRIDSRLFLDTDDADGPGRAAGAEYNDLRA